MSDNIKTFVRKVEPVQAIQYTGDNLNEVRRFIDCPNFVMLDEYIGSCWYADKDGKIVGISAGGGDSYVEVEARWGLYNPIDDLWYVPICGWLPPEWYPYKSKREAVKDLSILASSSFCMIYVQTRSKFIEVKKENKNETAYRG